MKYSIITPVYNREDCIGRCIKSVIRNLTPRPGIELEHIIVDDGSCDRTVDIIQEYCNEYKHIRFVCLPKNKGTNAARNAAIKTADSDFCILLDSDDYFVENAIASIDSVVSHSNYKAYMFAPNDMVEYYKRNHIIRGKNSTVLTFRNFLRKDIGGDFIHCVSTEILKKYPFDEKLRVFEGVFFLKFFKEAQSMLFTNTVVVIRERSRPDSVTRTMIATNKDTITKYYEANTLRYNWFKNDYISLKETDALSALLNTQLYYALLLQCRDKAKKWHNKLVENNLKIDTKNIILYNLRLGGLFQLLLKAHLTIKYKYLKKRVS